MIAIWNFIDISFVKLNPKSNFGNQIYNLNAQYEQTLKQRKIAPRMFLFDFKSQKDKALKRIKMFRKAMGFL